jgi:hypothetical protein
MKVIFVLPQPLDVARGQPAGGGSRMLTLAPMIVYASVMGLRRPPLFMSGQASSVH